MTMRPFSVTMCRLMLLSVAPLAIASSASAQTAAADPVEGAAEPEGGLAEIVVTAQSRKQSLQTVPVAVQVIGGEALEVKNVTDLASMTESVPAVTVTKSGSSDILMIRGIGSGANGGFEQSVGTYVDGVYLGRSRATRASLFDIDRVEVLKGPQTIFFGNSSIAGAFSIISASPKPGDGWSGNISGLASFMHGETNVEGGINIPVTDTLAVRVAARQWNMDGYVRNTVRNETVGGGDETFVRATAVWEPSTAFNATLKYFWGRSHLTTPFLKEVTNCNQTGAGVPLGRPGSSCVVNAGLLDNKLDYRIQNGSPEFSKARYGMASLTMNLDAGPISVTSISAYVRNRNRDLMDLDSGPRYNFVTNQYDDLEQYSQELRFTSAPSDVFDWIAGAYFQRTKIGFDGNQTPWFTANPAFQNAITAALARGQYLGAQLTRAQSDTTMSAFAAATIHLSPTLRLAPGLRYTAVDKDMNKRVNWAYFTSGELLRDSRVTAPAPFPGYLTVGSARRKGSWSKMLPSIGVEWDVADRTMAYAKYSKGFKAGGFDFSDRIGTSVPRYEEETVNAYEVGVKSRLLDGRMTIAADLFYSDYAGVQDAVLDPATFTFIVGNAAASSTRGFELDLTYQPVPRLTFNVNSTIMDAQYDSFRGSCSVYMTSRGQCPLGYQELAGKPTVFAPKYSGSIKATYALPIGDYELSFAPELFVSAGYFLQSDQDPTNRQPAYQRLDMRIAFARDNSWEIALLGKNLNNTRVMFFSNDLPGSSGTYMTGLKRPRSIAVQGRYRF